jgi:hypothetical protein
MGHLPIVDDRSLDEMIEKGAVLVKVPYADCRPSQKWADILADALCIRSGDYIFPWLVKSKQTGFSYQFRAADSAFLVEEPGYPVAVPVESSYRKRSARLHEGNALDFFPDSPGVGILWNAIGKKSLRRGRAITHQTPGEDNLMLRKLGELRSVRAQSRRPKLASCVPSRVAKAGVNISSAGRIAGLDLISGKWHTKGHFRWEKALEAYLISILGTKSQRAFLAALGLPKAKVIWFSNYLTYGVQGGSIDLLMLVRNGGTVTAIIIELKKDGLGQKPLARAVDQVHAYALYVEKAFTSFGQKVRIFPVIVSGWRSKPLRPSAKEGVAHILYQVKDGKVGFSPA